MRRLSVLKKHFPWRIFLRTVLIQAAILLIALVASGLSARYFFKLQFISQTRLKLFDTLQILAPLLPVPVNPKWCEERARGTELRLTVIAPDGKVLCDSHADPSNENALTRFEVAQALQEGKGESIHPSATLEHEMFYGAVKIPHHNLILRAALPLVFLNETMSVFDTSLGLLLFGIACVLFLFAVWSASRMVFPIGRLLVKAQALLSPATPATLSEAIPSFGEWSLLESEIENIRRNLQEKDETLNREKGELETVLGAISDAVLAVNAAGRPLFFNGRFELIFARGRLQSDRSHYWDVFREPEILNAFEIAIKEGRTFSTKAIPIESEGGGLRRFFSLSVAPLRKRDGALYGAVGIFHDVTDLKMAEQIRIDFVANATHELRTPVTSIKGFADTIRSDLKRGTPVTQEFIDPIIRNIDRLTALLNDLLDLSSLESIDTLQPEELNVREVTERVIESLQATLASKKESLEVEYRIPRVFADRTRLEQVLTNLLDNAIKYTPEHSKLQIVWEKDGADVLLRVKDNGPGIPVEHHSRLFERFYRVDKARSREQGGTGLGLAIVKHIMLRHGGSVDVESASAAGSVFTCRFPARGQA